MNSLLLNIGIVLAADPDRGRVRRRRDRAGLAARGPGARAGRARPPRCRGRQAGAATRTGSWPRCRSASRRPRCCPARSARSRCPTTAKDALDRPRLEQGPGRRDRHRRRHPGHLVRHAGRRRARPQAAGAAAHRGRGALFAPPLNRLASVLPAGHLAAVEVDQRAWCGCSAATRRRAASRSARRSCAAWSPRTSRCRRDERRLIDEVFAAGERTVSEVMVPRTEVIFLEAAMTVSRAAKIAGESTALALPGDRPRPGRRARLRAHPRPARSATRRADRDTHGRRAGPRDQGAAGLQARARRRCRRCAARATTWRSSSTSTAAPTASSPSRT